jgi:hypothetical protein
LIGQAFWLTFRLSVRGKSLSVRICEIVQSGAIAGLAAVPIVADMGGFKGSPRLVVAASVLAPLGLVSSLWIRRAGFSERGFWGAVLAIALYLWALSIPVMA